MRYNAMITDYDGTLTLDEHISPSTLSALGQLKDSGRKLILATGRRLEDIKSILPAYRVFNFIVAETEP
jgi:HAD superfamily hydrolase (TIGR01484 family)